MHAIFYVYIILCPERRRIRRTDAVFTIYVHEAQTLLMIFVARHHDAAPRWLNGDHKLPSKIRIDKVALVTVVVLNTRRIVIVLIIMTLVCRELVMSPDNYFMVFGYFSDIITK
jgi:hypothetical protein